MLEPGEHRLRGLAGAGQGCDRHAFSRSMSVTQAMEWLIEHADDPTVDTPLPGQFLVEQAAGADTSAAKAAGGVSLEAGQEEPKDELTEIFKKIRRKREFRPDPRVRGTAAVCVVMGALVGSRGGPAQP